MIRVRIHVKIPIEEELLLEDLRPAEKLLKHI